MTNEENKDDKLTAAEYAKKQPNINKSDPSTWDETYSKKIKELANINKKSKN